MSKHPMDEIKQLKADNKKLREREVTTCESHSEQMATMHELLDLACSERVRILNASIWRRLIWVFTGVKQIGVYPR